MALMKTPSRESLEDRERGLLWIIREMETATAMIKELSPHLINWPYHPTEEGRKALAEMPADWTPSDGVLIESLAPICGNFDGIELLTVLLLCRELRDHHDEFLSYIRRRVDELKANPAEVLVAALGSVGAGFPESQP